jgi:hypothetical protein
MPAEQAGTVSPVTETSTEAQEAASAAPQQPELRYNVGEVIDKLGLPKEIRDSFADKAKPEEDRGTKPPPPPPPESEETPVKEGEPAEVKAEENEEKKTEDEEEAPKQDEEEEETGAPPEAKKLLKRIDKLTAQRRRAEERALLAEDEIASLRAQMEEQQPLVVSPSPNDPLANVTSPAQLNQLNQEWKMARDWARKHPDGVVLNEGKENERTVTRDEMMDTLSRAEDMLNEFIPNKRVALQAKVQYDAAAKEVYPNLFDRKHADHQAARAVMAEVPGLASHPASFLLIGDYLEGVKIRLAKAQKNGAPEKVEPKLDERITAPKPPIAEHTPNPPTRTHVPTARKKIEEADKQFIESRGSNRALDQMIKARLEARTQKGTREPVTV